MSLNIALNKVADGAEFFMKNVGSNIVPTALGGVGGWLLGLGWQKGAIQGLVAGSLLSWAILPIGVYIQKHAGSRKDQLHPNTIRLLWTAGTIVQWVVPIFATLYGADFVLNRIGMLLSSRWQWLVQVNSKRPYTFLTGVLVNFAPVITQYTIKYLRSAGKS